MSLPAASSNHDYNHVPYGTQLCQRPAFLCGLILLCQLSPTRPIGCQFTDGRFVARPLVCCLLLSPCCHICGRRWCGPILLLLPRLLSAAAPSPLTAVIIVVKLRVGLSRLLMPLRRHHSPRCHRCSPIFAHSPPPPIVVFASPSSSAPLSPRTWARGRWRGRPLPIRHHHPT